MKPVPVQPSSVTAWHARSVADTIAGLGTDEAGGISGTEASARLERHGPNTLGEEAGPGRLSIFLDQFRNVMVWILLVAALVSGALLGEWVDTGVILAIVILNAVLGYGQEARAEEALARLKEMSAPEALAIRDGRESTVATADLVPGDIVVLAAGDRVPADCRVVAATHLELEEAALTGESLPVAKSTAAVADDAGVGDRTSMTFAGTTVAAGRGRAVVVATGRATVVGQIAALLGEEEPETPLSIELERVGRRLAILAVSTAAVVFLTGTLRGAEPESMLLTAVALAVAAIPEGLPAVVTITLSRGVQRMADQNAIVRRLPAVEALGSATVICTDKTGTLTRNEMRVQEIVLSDVNIDIREVPPDELRLDRFMRIAVVANDARPDPEGGYRGDPTETALLYAVESLGGDPERLFAQWPRIDEIAFDSRRKRMSTLHRASGFTLMMKGAPEVVVDRCSFIEGPDGVEPIDELARRRMLENAELLANRGLRTLAFAYRPLDDEPDDLAAAEEACVLVAIVGMSDEARDEAAPSVAEAHAAGIRVVMVTGDHQVTAEAIAAQLGILVPDTGVMPGDVLSRLSVEELAEEVDRYTVYARVDPVDKVKIVHAWQRRGEIVAMTGDGVNDAPASRAADIGVAMGSGTDVAREASSMVLADDNFATIVSAVREGRGIFANLKKVVYFLLSANASEVLLMFVGFLVFGGLGEPLLAVQLLWINLVTDGLPALALGMDPPPPGVMTRPPDRQRDILSARRQLRLLVFGAILAAAALAAIVIGHYGRDLPWIQVQTAVFTVIVLAQLAHGFNIRSPDTRVWSDGLTGNRVLVVGMAVSLLLHLAVVYTPPGRYLFATEAFPGGDWLWIAGLTLASFIAVDLVKRRVPFMRVDETD